MVKHLGAFHKIIIILAALTIRDAQPIMSKAKLQIAGSRPRHYDMHFFCFFFAITGQSHSNFYYVILNRHNIEINFA